MQKSPDASLTLDNGLWLSVTALAKLKGVTKQTVGEKVARLERDGLLLGQCEGRGKPKLINVAAYDRAVGETTDLMREQGAATKKATQTAQAPALISDSVNPVYSAEQARHMALKADMAQLDLDERIGKLLPLHEVTEAMTECAEALVRAIDQISTHAEALADAVGKGGVNGARGKLKEIARELRETLSQSMRLLSERDTDAKPSDEERSDQASLDYHA
jgi:hypothetical protein